MVYMPPRHGKSQLVSRLFPGYFLRRKPDKFAALASYAARLAHTLSRNARDYYKRSGGALDPAASSVMQWETGYGGGMWATGLEGSATGHGFSVGIIDDPVKNWEEAYSPTIQERNWNFWQSTWTTRMNEEDSALIVMCTRWHEADLAGQILQHEKDEDEDPEKWTILNMEAIKTEKPISFPASCLVVNDYRKVGEALNPERFGEKYLAKKERAVGAKVWASLYQQNPTPLEGMLWKEDWFGEDQLFDSIPPGLLFIGNDWDTAYTKDEENSASAFVKMGILRTGDVYLLDLGFQWLEFPGLISWMRRVRDSHYIEAKASGKSARQTLSSHGIDAVEVQIEGGGDKVARTTLATPVAESGKLFVRRSIAHTLLHHDKQGILRFPGGVNDDLNDALVQGINRVRKKLKHLLGSDSDDIPSVSGSQYTS